MEEELLNQENERLAGVCVEDNPDAGTNASPDPEQGRVESEEPVREKPILASPQDIKRAAIAARFKADGSTPTAFDGDLNRPENLYGTAAQEVIEPEPTAGDDPIIGDVQPVAQPAKRKLNIRGTVVEMTDDELVAAAQKTLAGDSYLEDARKILDEAKTIKAERAGRDPQHPEGRSSTQDDELDPDATDRSQHPEDDMESLIEELQFGSDRKGAAKRLKEVIQSEAAKSANEGHQARLFNNDLARSQQALADFKAANPDLEADPLASRAIEQLMYDQYREDIIKLGVVDEAQIPSDPRTLANWHRWYRVNGQAVRSTPDLLNGAKEKFAAWRGTSSKPAPQAQRQAPPRVEINVDRDSRRQAIPLQPSRAVTPRRDAVANPPKSTDSDVVKQMRRARGQPVA
jgi:hypothetical protein